MILRESITSHFMDFSGGLFRIRIWRQENENGEIDISNLYKDLELIWTSVKDMDPKSQEMMNAIGDKIIALSNVNAVEVIKNSGNLGIVLYNNWP